MRDETSIAEVITGTGSVSKGRMKKLIKIKDVFTKIPYSRSQIYSLIAKGKFPTPVHLGGRASLRVESEIDESTEGHIDAVRRVA